MHANVPVRFGRGRLDSLGNKGLAAYLIRWGSRITCGGRGDRRAQSSGSRNTCINDLASVQCNSATRPRTHLKGFLLEGIILALTNQLTRRPDSENQSHGHDRSSVE